MDLRLDADTGAPSVTFGHVALITADLDRFRRFYEDALGLRTVMIDHPQGMAFRRQASLTDAGGSYVRVMAFEVPGYASGLADDVVGRRGRLDHVAFHLDDPETFSAVVLRLVELGATSGEVGETGPVRSVLFVDPDGAHHHLQTPNPSWWPGRTTEITDPAAWCRLRAAAEA